MTAGTVWTFTPVDARGGIVLELDVKAEASDGRTELFTVTRWSTGWRIPERYKVQPSVRAALLRVARETEQCGAIA